MSQDCPTSNCPSAGGEDSKSLEKDKVPCDRYIVGIGASAGGLEALERFFAAVPENPGMSYVVVQHLSPDYESHMEDLLARRTDMPIRRVSDGMVVEDDAVYLIPPAKNMIISEGKLLLTEKDSTALSYPIDTFFRSLANDSQKSSIGIILSGTGTDGTLGAQDIHEAGGLVIAQDEESAKFTGMPSSVSEAGIVDLTMAPEDMPAALDKYVSQNLNRDTLVQNLPPAIPASALEVIFDRLHARYRIDFSQYKPNTITRRIQRRIEINDDLDLETYAARVSEDSAEVDALYRDLLIGVTKFFRDSEVFDVLLEKAIRPIVKDYTEEIRVWVPGCASGEEAYSIAILIHEECLRQKKDFRLKMFASDVHQDSIRHAGEGVYTKENLAEVGEERLSNYFKEFEGGYQISAEIRQAIVFTEHNLMKDVPFTRLDLVSCRNLLIYLQTNAQKRIFSFFHFGLRTGGRLLLGPSETVGDLEDEFEVIDKHWKLFRKRRDTRLVKDFQHNGTFASSAGPYGRRTVAPFFRNSEGSQWEVASRDSNLLRTYDLLLDHFMPPGVLVDERHRLVHIFSGGEKYLKIRPGRSSQGLLDVIVDGLKASVSGALQHAAKERRPVRYTGIQLGNPGTPPIDLTVTPFVEEITKTPSFVVTFQPLEEKHPRDGARSDLPPRIIEQDDRRELEAELRYTKENLQATIEELETSNEELQATNEELIASNEELQSSNEELHSVNEELDTVNGEYQKKIRQLTEVTDDLDNVLSAAEIGAVFLTEDLKIRKFTPRIGQVFRLMRSDAGRGIFDFSHQLRYEGMELDLKRVAQSKMPHLKEIDTGDGATYLLRIGPYNTEGESEGLILTTLDITPIVDVRKRVNELSDIVDTSNDAIIGFSSTGKITRWNSGAETLYGYTADEAEGRNALDLIIPEESASQFLKDLASALEGNDVPTRQVERRSKSNSSIIVASRLSTATGTEDGQTRLASIERDITDELQIRYDRDRLASILEKTSDLVAILDESFRLTYINEAGKSLVGLPSDVSARGMNISDFYPEKTMEKTISKMTESVRRDGIWSGRSELFHQDGTVIPVSQVTLFHPSRNGGPCYYSTIIRDLTEEQKVLDQVRAAERKSHSIARKFRAVVKNFPEMLIVVDRQLGVEFASKDAHSFMERYTEEGELPLKIGDLVRCSIENDQSYLPDDFNGVREIMLEDGSRRWYLTRITVFHAEDHQPAGAVITLQDVTEFRMLNELQTDMINTVSHELKNPLSSLTISLGLALDGSLGELDERQKSVLSAAYGECNRIAEMISSMLDLSRFQEGNGGGGNDAVSVNNLVDECVSHNQRLANTGEINLVVDINDDVGELSCHPERTEIILNNLLSNAIKHSPPGSDVTITVTKDNDHVKFSVSDNGPGLNEEFQSQIFSKFFRVPGNQKQGNGLGLSIAKRFVDAQNGRIWVDSKPGEGATFSFVLPAVSKAAAHS